MKKIFLAMMLLATFVFAGCNTQAAVNKEVKAGNDDLKISMLNIGFGDSILIRTKEQTILIDTGHSSNPDRLARELEKLSVTKIDKLIITHPHSDHIGNVNLLINPNEKQLAENPYFAKISVGEVYDNGVPYGGALYRNYLKNINAKKIPHKGLTTGDELDFGGGVKFKVLFPTAEFVEEINKVRGGKHDKYVDADRMYRLNNSSVVGRLTYKDFSMLFTGDCEKESEAKILEICDAKDLKCDVIKAGHHGSRTSSSAKFVKAVNPSVVLITGSNKGKNNDAQGAPHLKVLENYMAQGVDKKNIFCTSWNGTITLTTDGKNFSVTPEFTKDWIDDWIAKKKQMNVI